MSDSSQSIAVFPKFAFLLVKCHASATQTCVLGAPDSVPASTGKLFEYQPCPFITPNALRLVPVPRTIVLRTNHQTSSFPRPAVCCLNDINLLLLVVDNEVLFIVVARPEVHHDMLVPIEKHDRHRVVEFVHLVEVLDLFDVADVDDRKVLDAVGDLVEDLILQHAVFIMVLAEADHDKALVFR